MRLIRLHLQPHQIAFATLVTRREMDRTQRAVPGYAVVAHAAIQGASDLEASFPVF